MFELCAQKRRQQFRRQIARPDIDPVVFVDFAPEKSAPICSLFPKNFSSLIKLCVIDQERAAFSARKIFRFMETESCQLPKRAQIPPAISSVKTMRVIFDDRDCMPACDCQNRVHLAADARVVHNKNRFRTVGNPLFDLALVDVQRVRADIHEDGSGAAQDERICSGGESERG